MSKITALAIHFPDRDFINTVTQFIRVLNDNDVDSYTLTKEHICDLFNRAALGLYFLTQNREISLSHRRGATIDEHAEHVRKYLTLIPRYVLLGREEIKAYIDDRGGDCNGELHAIDWSDPSQPPYLYSV